LNKEANTTLAQTPIECSTDIHSSFVCEHEQFLQIISQTSPSSMTSNGDNVFYVVDSFVFNLMSIESLGKWSRKRFLSVPVH